MNKARSFPCPNCGGYGTRRYFVGQEDIHHRCPNRQLMTTECSLCDYLMTVCSLDGKVIETSSSPFATSRVSTATIANPPVKLSAKKEKSAGDRAALATRDRKMIAFNL